MAAKAVLTRSLAANAGARGGPGPAEPAGGLREAQAQAEAPRAVAELLLHGRQVPGTPTRRAAAWPPRPRGEGAAACLRAFSRRAARDPDAPARFRRAGLLQHHDRVQPQPDCGAVQRLLGGAVPADRGARAADGGCAPCAPRRRRAARRKPWACKGSAVGALRLAPAARFAARGEAAPAAAWIRALGWRRRLGLRRPARLRPITLKPGHRACAALTHALTRRPALPPRQAALSAGRTSKRAHARSLAGHSCTVRCGRKTY